MFSRALQVLRLILMLLPAAALGQSPAAPELASAREFVARLTLNQQSDTRLFHETGLDRSTALLVRVMSRGQAPDATTADWANMHRAVEGLIELNLEQGNGFKAAVFAGLQDNFYRNFDEDYASALKSAQRALDLQRQSGVTETLDVAWSAVGRDYFALGNAAEALRCFREAISASKDQMNLRTARAWRDAVHTEIALGRREDARAELRRLLEMARLATAPFRAEALLAQADVAIGEENFDVAVSSVEEARAAATTDKTDAAFEWEAASELMTCVLASMDSIPYADAVALAKRIDREVTGLPINVAAFAEQAILVRRRLAGEVDAVLREQVADLAAARAEGRIPAQIETLRHLAVTYQAANSIENQIATLEKSIQLEKTLPGPRAYSYWRTVIALGDAYVLQREPGKARRCFDEVTKGLDSVTEAASARGMKPLYGEAVLGKAAVAALDDDPDTAREILDQALAGKTNPRASFVRADTLLQRARLERDLDETPAAAARFYAEAIESLAQTRKRPALVAARLEYAHFLTTHRTRLPDAIRLAREQITPAAQEAEASGVSDSRWRVRYESGLAFEPEERTAEALEQYRQAADQLEVLRTGFSQQDQRQSFMDRDVVQDLYRRVVSLSLASGDQAVAWRYVERAKARSFLDALQGRRFRSEDSPGLRQLNAIERQIAGLRAQLTPENEALLRSAGKEPAVLRVRMRELEAQFALASQESELSRSRAGQALAADPISLAKVRRLLPPKTALIEYELLNGVLAAFVVTADGARIIQWKANASELRTSVMRLRSLVADENSGQELQGALAVVSESVLTPLSAALPDSIERLIVVPSGVLHYVPFQVLAFRGQALIERFAISYLPSASSLQFLTERSGRPSDLFLGALGKVVVDGWAPLPGTLAETDGISKVFPGAERASEEAFTYSNVRSALQKHTAVHFATHGLLDDQAPLFSALLTASAKGEPSRFSLYELTDMRVRARLVVLSACETGLGKLLGGDEVAGLTRAFLTAGANTVVSSLWKVSDDSTAMLMQQFYRRLRNGRSPAVAMRESALEVRKKYPHPFFWAPFIVTGVL